MPDGHLGFLDSEEPLPFEHLFVPLVLDARGELRLQVEEGVYWRLTSEGFAGWERYLLTRLTTACAPAAYWQFEIFKTARATFSAEGPAGLRPVDQLYKEFVGDDPRIRLGKLFGAFPALGALSSTIVRNWLSTVAEFLERLASDQSGFDSSFANVASSGQVIQVDAGLSDPHRGGRCVARVHFESGSRLFYKPRPVACEAHFSVLVERFNTRPIPTTLRAARCWDRGSYGWMEEILHQPCCTPEHIAAFYWRAGVLLGLVHLSRGIDFHCENLVAAGSFPVLVDLETLWHPRMAAEHHPEVPAGSVMRTGFLPQNNVRLASYEWGALSRKSEARRNVRVWAFINQDAMRICTSQIVNVDLPHLPELDGVKYLATDFTAEILAGYVWAGEQLLENDNYREEFSQWLEDLRRCPRRIIYRITGRYQHVLERLTEPEILQREREWHLLLGGAFSGGASNLESEWKSLAEGDVPYFLEVAGADDDPVDGQQRLPTTEAYTAQITTIADALARTASPEDRPDDHHGGTVVQMIS